MRVHVDGWAWISLDELDASKLSWIKERLTLVQKVSSEYRSRVTPGILTCYVEDKENRRIGIPREFFFDKVTRDHTLTYDVSDGDTWPERADVPDGETPAWASCRSEDPTVLTFYDTEKNRPVTLKGEQQQALSVAVDHLNSRPAVGGIVQAPTAWGKTIWTLALIHRLKKKTAVLVHRKFLMDQWKKRIRRFLPDAKIGFIYGSKWKDVEGAHIVLVMTETLASWVKNGTVRPEIPKMFGLVATDEVHRASAPTWAPVMPMFHARNRIGVSARPKRSDGLDKAFFYHIGPTFFTGHQLMMDPLVRRVWTNFKITHPRLNQDLMSKEMATRFLSASTNYNQAIVDQIKAALSAGRKILVYSHKIDHLRKLKQEVDTQYSERAIKTDFFIGGMTEADQDEAANADVIFASYQMCLDALDIPALDTVVLATPIRNPEQPVGRILRELENKKQPIVVDIRADSVPICREYAESRDRAYERLYGLKPPSNK